MAVHRDPFYFVAWRLHEVLNGKPSFPRLTKLNAAAIRNVRNLLIEHPEDGRPEPNYQQSFIVTDDGPVLKCLEIRIDARTGQGSPAKTSVDRGLYRNAEDFLHKMERCLRRALEV